MEWVELDTRRTTLSESSQRGLKSQLTCYTHQSGDELREIVAARREVDVEKVRRLVSGRLASVTKVSPASEPYEAVLRSDDPVRAIRELVGKPSADDTFVQLHAAGRAELSLEGLVVEHEKELGVPAAVVKRARDRLDYYGA